MSQRVSFTKGHGTGNDFVILPDLDDDLQLTGEQVAVLCDRRFGIGADGLLRVVRQGDGWFMDYRNSDGSVAEMCGNGIRVFVHYLVESGLVSGDEPVLVQTRAGERAVAKTPHGYEVGLGRVHLIEDDTVVSAAGLPISRPGSRVEVGNPHVVVALSSLAELDQLELSRPPTIAPAPANGANVEFVVPAEPLVTDGVGAIRMRVHERGSGETLSCGTGVAAAAFAVRNWAGAGAPDRWIVHVPGGTLQVRFTADAVYLEGPATLVFTGEVTLATH